MRRPQAARGKLRLCFACHPTFRPSRLRVFYFYRPGRRLAAAFAAKSHGRRRPKPSLFPRRRPPARLLQRRAHAARATLNFNVMSMSKFHILFPACLPTCAQWISMPTATCLWGCVGATTSTKWRQRRRHGAPASFETASPRKKQELQRPACELHPQRRLDYRRRQPPLGSHVAS